MSSIASIESELRNRLSSLPRFSLRGHPLSCYPKSKGDICPSPYDFYAFPSISFVFPMAFVVWGALPSRFLMRFLTRAHMCAFPGISTFLLSQPSHATCFKLEKSGCCSHVKPVLEISRLRLFSRRDLWSCWNMSEKCLLRLDTKSVMRKSVKVVKAKRHKLQWCACARPREERGLQHFLRWLSCYLAMLSMRRDFLGKVL